MCRIYVVRKIYTISKVNYPLYHLKDETMDSGYQTFFRNKKNEESIPTWFKKCQIIQD